MNMKQDDKNRKIRTIIKFFLIFFGVIGLYYAIVLFMNESLFEPYINLNAYLSGNLIKLFADNVSVSGNKIISDGLVIILSFGCEGSESLVIFIAGLLAFPSKLNYKLKGLFLGGAVLYALNIIRIIILFFIGKMDFEIFHLFHDEILPIVFIIISVIAWVIWLKGVEKKNA